MREQILDFFNEHPERSYAISEVCGALVPDGKGKSTVYRVVAAFVESGQIRRISDPATRHCTYQALGCGGCARHLHLRCTECGKVLHLDRAMSDFFRAGVRSGCGFELEPEKTMLFGLCASCRKRA